MGSEGVALAADLVRRCPPGGFHARSSPGGVHAPLLAGGSPPAHPCRRSSTRRTTCLGKRGAVSGADAPYHDEASIRSASGSRGGDAPRAREVMCSECSRRAAPVPRQGDPWWCWISTIPQQIEGSLPSPARLHAKAPDLGDFSNFISQVVID